MGEAETALIRASGAVCCRLTLASRLKFLSVSDTRFKNLSTISKELGASPVRTCAEARYRYGVLTTRLPDMAAQMAKDEYRELGVACTASHA